MKAVIKPLAFNKVFIAYDDFMGDRIEHTIKAPIGGGYVRFEDGYQVCNGLSHMGYTLYWDGVDSLVHLIRAEYRKMRKIQSKMKLNFEV